MVDDDPTILSLTSLALEMEGYRVQTALNGREALQLVEQGQPALIVLDMRMPIMNGWDVARALQERGLDVPLLVCSAAQDGEAWAREVGARQYVAKPFDLNDFLDAVAAVLRDTRQGEPPAG